MNGYPVEISPRGTYATLRPLFKNRYFTGSEAPPYGVYTLRIGGECLVGNRGLQIARGLVVERGVRLCLLCACADYADCHRKLIAEALVGLLPPGATHRDLSSRG